MKTWRRIIIMFLRDTCDDRDDLRLQDGNENDCIVGCSEAGWREDVHEDEKSAEPLAGESY